MESSQIFYCKIHLNEVIKRICIDQYCKHPICCIECILKIHGDKHHNSLLSLDDFFNMTSSYSSPIKSNSKQKLKPSKDLIEFLSQKNEEIEKISVHIENEKKLLKNSFELIIKEFQSQCLQIQEKLINELDSQLATIAINYSLLKFNVDKLINDFPSKNRSIYEKLNEISNIEDFDIIIGQALEDLETFDTNKNKNSYENELLERCQKIVDFIKAQKLTLPKISHTIENDGIWIIEDFKKGCSIFFQEIYKLQNPFEQITRLHIQTFLHSKILSKIEDIIKLKELISDNPIKFNLLYRGSRDGFNASSFLKKCEKKGATVTLISTDAEKILGGYIEDEWGSSTHSSKNNAFLFLLNENEKYVFKDKTTMPFFHTHNSFGFAGSELSISDNCNQGLYSSCVFGIAYTILEDDQDLKNPKKESFKFKAEEVEVFQVIIQKEKMNLNDRSQKIYKNNDTKKKKKSKFLEILRGCLPLKH